MATKAAARALRTEQLQQSPVARVGDLVADGWSYASVQAQIDARRWRRFGTGRNQVVLLHGGEPTRPELRRIVVLTAGPRAGLTSFTALEDWGLTRWEREELHLLLPGGARITTPADLPVKVHRVRDWDPRRIHPLRSLHRVPDAAVLAAASLHNPRHGCGLLAATVQQRLTRPGDIVEALAARPKLTNRLLLLAAAHDIGMGAQALSEIDFVRLCRSAGVPRPDQQSIRHDKWGKKRYLDATWRLRSGRRLVVEVDGAIHLAALRWWDDQLRQNEVVIAGDPVLRFPSVIIRCEAALVVDQLRRALTL